MDSQAFRALQLIKSDGTVGVRIPVRPSIDSMLGRFLKVEEYATSKDTHESWVRDCIENIHFDSAWNKSVGDHGKNAGSDEAEQEVNMAYRMRAT